MIATGPRATEHRAASRWRAALAFALGSAIALGACAGDMSEDPPTRGGSVWSVRTDDGPVELRVEVADTDAERRRGLMGRRGLGEDAGMAFLFEEPTTATFWMKDTLIPLSIAFWDADGRIVAIVDMPPCEADPCPHYGSPEPYVGAVEANLGWFRSNGVEVGDVVEREPVP